MKKYKVTSEHPHLKSGLILEYYKESEKDDGYNLEGTNRPYYSCLDIANWLKEGFIEEIKKVYEVGKYYKDPSSSEIFFIDEEKNMYGFDVDGLWLNDECFLIGEPLDYYMETTEQEFKERLLRYVKENYTEGVKFIPVKYIEGEKTILSEKHSFGISEIISNDIQSGEIPENEWGDKESKAGSTPIIYSKGQWAKIIKKPICKLGGGNFLYDGDLEKSKVYNVECSNYKYVIRADKLEGECIHDLGAINVSLKNYDSGSSYLKIDDIMSIKQSSEKTVKWLERCEKSKKYTPRKEKKKYTDSDMIEFHKFSTAESTEYAKKDLKDWKKRVRKNDKKEA